MPFISYLKAGSKTREGDPGTNPYENTFTIEF